MTGPPRPGFHLTAPAGWINDPLGVTWHETPDGGRYELFIQFNPDAPVWAPACRWGQVTSADLVRWRGLRTALEPAPGETGCWSGSVVVPDGQAPVIVYTSVLADALSMGRVALATGDASWTRWTPDAAGPVLAAPPPELDLAHVRDPFVWREGVGWRMALGAGRRDGRPAVLAYSSPDLRTWTFDGVLAEPPPGPPAAGAAWECPQLVPLDGRWVLLVSVWDGDPVGVAGAVGAFDGRRFTPARWQALAPGPVYATTAFVDRDGRRCVLSWIRDPGPAEGAWAGALTLPWLLGRDGDRITVAPHPDVDTLRTGPVTGAEGAVGPVEPFLDVTFRPHPAGRRAGLVLAEGSRELARVVVDPSGAVTLAVPDRPAVPVGPRGPVRLLVDAGVVEVFAGGGVAVGHVAATGAPVTLRATAPDGRSPGRLDVQGMARVLG